MSSTQAASRPRHTRPTGQSIVGHTGWHEPSRQLWRLPSASLGQTTPAHGSVMQKFRESHTLPAGHGNSPGAHCAAHSPWSHTPPLHRSPSSIRPSQSSSTPLHTSVPPPVPPTHSIAPAMHLVTPPLHAPPAAPHGSPSPATLSSTVPSQSSSIPLHCSATGPV